MASVREVYQGVRDLANKDERGMISPAEFNSFAAVAQMKLFNDMFQNLTNLERLTRANADSAFDKSLVKQLKEDIATYSKTITIAKSNDVFERPEDFAKLIALSTAGSVLNAMSTSTHIAVIEDEAKLQHVLNSTLSAPSTDNPVAVPGENYEVFPTNIRKIKMRYYKLPEGRSVLTGARTASYPRFGFTVLNGKEVFDSSTSIDFDMPEHYIPELIKEIAVMAGINLRDPQVTQFGLQKG